MGHRNWRGFADFNMLSVNGTEAIMTVCPGNPEQEGRRFRTIMELAGAKLTRLHIIEAGDLGYHNLKRFVPKDQALAFARFRGQQWVETHQGDIDRYMSGRCEIIPMQSIVDNTNHQERIELIKAIYNQGDNPVTDWFDYSIGLDIETREKRKEKSGVIIEPWAIKESALDYLCEEYSMRSLMLEKYGLKEIYLGLAVTQQDLFQKENKTRADINLTIPEVCPITLHEVKMVHVKEIGNSVPKAGQDIPSHAHDFGAIPKYV